MGRWHTHRGSVARRSLRALVSSAPALAQTGPRPDPQSEQHAGRHDQDSAAGGDSAARDTTARKPRVGHPADRQPACWRSAPARIPAFGAAAVRASASGSPPPPPERRAANARRRRGCAPRSRRPARRLSSCSRPTSNWRRPRSRRSPARSHGPSRSAPPPSWSSSRRRAARRRWRAVPRRVALRLDGLGVVHGVLVFVVDRPRGRDPHPSACRPTSALRAARPRDRRRRGRASSSDGLPNWAYAAIGDASGAGVERASARSSSGWSSVGLIGLLVGLIVAWRRRSRRRRSRSAAGSIVGGVVSAPSRPSHTAAGRRGVGIAVGYAELARRARRSASSGPASTSRRSRLASPDPDHRDQQGDARVATETDAARDRVIAARADWRGADIARGVGPRGGGHPGQDQGARPRRPRSRAAPASSSLRGPRRLFGARKRAVAGRRSRCHVDAARRDREDPALARQGRRQGPRRARAGLRRLHQAGPEGSDASSILLFVAVLRPLVLRASRAAADAVLPDRRGGVPGTTRPGPVADRAT